MTKLGFYNGATGEFLEDMSSDVKRLWFTVGLNGDLDGTVEIEGHAVEGDLLYDAGENSHFIRVGLDRVHGGVVSSARLDGNIWTIDFTGAQGWWDKMHSTSPDYARGGSAPRDSNAGVIVFYADSVTGILYEIFNNQALSMEASNWPSSVIDYSQLSTQVAATTGDSWKRSYRLNSFETPSFASVVNDVIGDFEDDRLFLVSTSQVLSDPFSFIIESVERDPLLYPSYDLYENGRSGEAIFNVSFNYSDVKKRAMGVATGTNLKGEQQIAVRGNKTPDDGMAYSSNILPSASEASDAIRGMALRASYDNTFGSYSFSTFEQTYNILDEVTLYILDPLADNRWTYNSYSGLINEISVDGTTVTYSVTMNSAPSSSTIKSAPSVERDLIFNPLNEVAWLSKSNARRTSNSTGWRN